MATPRLNHYRIEAKTEGQTDRGQSNQPWEEVGEMWGSIQELRGMEAVAARTIIPQATSKITNREHIPWLTTAHRLKNTSGTIYNIGQVNSDNIHYDILTVSDDR